MFKKHQNSWQLDPTEKAYSIPQAPSWWGGAGCSASKLHRLSLSAFGFRIFGCLGLAAERP